MPYHSKHIKKQLRELLAIAYKRELDAALSNLCKQFEAWQQNEMDCWDLNDAIHKFHDGISRDLYKQYVMSGNSDHGWLVAHALDRKVLSREEIPDEILQALAK